MISPSRIILQPQACPPNRPSTLYSLLDELLPEAQVVAYERSAWSEADGLDYIQGLAFRNDVEPIKVALDGKFYAVACFGAVSQILFYSCSC